MASRPGDLQGAIAATRFGLGARPGEIAAAAADPRGWLIAQIRPEGADLPPGPLPTSAEGLQALYAYRAERKDVRLEKINDPGQRSQAQAEAFKAAQKALRVGVEDEFLARARLGASTQAGFRERWTLFWANHFTVSATKQASGVIAGAFEREGSGPMCSAGSRICSRPPAATRPC